MNQPHLDIIKSRSVYTDDELALINQENIPKHIAVIMDGNRRWAKNQNAPVDEGHWEGAEVINVIIRAAGELGVKVLTTYAFSTENWSRSDEEVRTLMDLFEVYLVSEREALVKEGVKLESIGDISKFPETVKQALRDTKEATKYGRRIELVLALNYGGRDEIRRAAIKAANDLSLGKIIKEQLTEEVFATYLDTAQWPDPDLLIRTSGEMRLSNFLLWQLAYSEIIVTDVLWPAFNENHLLNCILEFQCINRRRGE